MDFAINSSALQTPKSNSEIKVLLIVGRGSKIPGHVHIAGSSTGAARWVREQTPAWRKLGYGRALQNLHRLSQWHCLLGEIPLPLAVERVC
jgi:hypothetical protein